ncbi:hypothetical protein Fmac_000225 [Flemingia macrophylla]|uniref:Subtilisin-like protease fibronectin type-III domain-containing protein n=1 Tax=Flemingia macrophylla TaxID=520843 RepID=A0ABD1NDN7_9FABA
MKHSAVAPSEVNVKLIPDKLQFTKSSKKLSYQVIFSSTLTSLKEDLFGSITWCNDSSLTLLRKKTSATEPILD